MIKEKDYVGGKDMSKTVYKLNVQLKGAKPECFRTFIIRSDCKMMTLASTIIAIFNGNASHIYNFDVPAKKLDVQIYIDEGMNDNDDDFAINVRHEQPSKHVDARKYKISDCFEKVGDEAAFLYDFGDGWQFDIRLQEIIEDQVYEEVSPWVLEGSGLGIIEDCGGIGGLERIQEVFEQGEGEEYEGYCDWLGTSNIDFTKFNRTAINKKLAKEVAKIDRAYKNPSL